MSNLSIQAPFRRLEPDLLNFQRSNSPPLELGVCSSPTVQPFGELIERAYRAVPEGRMLFRYLRGMGKPSPGPASVGGPGYPSLTTAILALDRIDFAAGLRRLHHHRKSGAIACRTFMLGRFHGWLSHLNLSGARPSWALWVHHDVAGRTMEVGAILGCNNLKAI
jgi:hypothetical protein